MVSLVVLCSIAGFQEQMLDAAQADDHVAPAAAATSFDIVRFDNDGGCGGGAENSCSDTAIVAIAVTASDDRTPADKIGYQLTLVSGELPAGMTLPQGAVVPFDGKLNFVFRAEDRGGFTADLEVRARDLNGNLGPPTIVTISEAGDGGCRTSGASGLGLWVLAAFAWLMRPARARVTR
jgi:hypothetical protein